MIRMAKELKIGLLSVVTLALIIWGYIFVKGENLFADNNNYYAYYSNVKELTVAAPIQVNGLNVGTVKSIDLDPTDVSKIKVAFTISSDVRIPNSTIAYLKSVSPLGGKFIDLDFDKMCDGSNCATEGQELKGETVGLIGSIIDQKEAKEFGDAFGGSINETIQNLGSEDSDAALDKSIRNMAIITENLAQLTDKLNNVLGSTSSDIDKTMANVNKITTNLADNNEQISQMIDNMNKMSKQLADADIGKTVKSAEQTMTSANDMITSLQTSVKGLDTTLQGFSDVATKLNDGSGSLGKLLNDKQLYTNLEETSKHLALLLQDMRLNPKRYVNVSLIGRKDKKYIAPEEDPGLKEEDNKSGN